MADYYLKQSDTGQTVSDILYDPAGDPINLNGTTVKFIARRRGVIGTADISRSCATTATQGEAIYTPTAQDLAAPGVYDQEWQVTLANGGIITVPNFEYNTLTISPELGS